MGAYVGPVRRPERGEWQPLKNINLRARDFDPKVQPISPLGTQSSRSEYSANQCSLTEQKNP
jgi:hypothetical protein